MGDRRSPSPGRRAGGGRPVVVMARKAKPPTARTVETLRHRREEATRKNIPTAEYQSVLEKEAQAPGARRLRAPQPRPRPAARLARQGRAGLERPRRPRPAALHPGEGPPQGADRRPAAPDARSAAHDAGRATPDLFADFNGIPKGVDKTEFYQHDQNWSNRMILGDSLQVMASLAEREGLRGKVQCIYIDPPYGIKFNSNFQWTTTSRDVKDGNADAHHPRAGAGQGLPRHLARRHPQLPHLPARSAHRRSRSAHRFRLHLRADRRRERASRPSGDG